MYVHTMSSSYRKRGSLSCSLLSRRRWRYTYVFAVTFSLVCRFVFFVKITSTHAYTIGPHACMQVEVSTSCLAAHVGFKHLLFNNNYCCYLIVVNKSYINIQESTVHCRLIVLPPFFLSGSRVDRRPCSDWSTTNHRGKQEIQCTCTCTVYAHV